MADIKNTKNIQGGLSILCGQTFTKDDGNSVFKGFGVSSKGLGDAAIA